MKNVEKHNRKNDLYQTIGKVIIATDDLTYLIFLLVYGVDGVLTIHNDGPIKIEASRIDLNE